MKGYCGRCFEMRLAERPGHDVKWPRLMEAMKVYLTELKAATWNYLVSLRLVLS